ncbi:MAG: 16S rRNA (adenine(1518)-N(6)/adenine(1519)-N(6))-dimethyltransferase RsmA [Gammaproteobacteria bacterium]|nr:16S rRNA (adenine(1518)-N(6)/adenine(1519)-N(6))-dimethyltransferase RsmA [Gammaproteobacteria bacterium]
MPPRRRSAGGRRTSSPRPRRRIGHGDAPDAERGLHARKHLGQHFLHDPAVIRRLIDAIDPRPDDAMVEIGGGRGALTAPLLERVRVLHVIELDPRFVSGLENLGSAEHRLVLHPGDALKFDFASLAPPGRALRVAGNLPYNISTPLLFRLLSFRESIRDMHLMLQKEVAARMTAAPGGRDYGRLTVMLAPWTDIESCFDIGPGAFSPPPKVWSTFVRIVPRKTPRFPIADQRRFAATVAHLFSMRRKTLGRALKGRVPEARIEALGIDPKARPETLAPEDFAKLAETVPEPAA